MSGGEPARYRPRMLAAFLVLAASALVQAQPTPAASPHGGLAALGTRWTHLVDRNAPRAEHPRPQLVRERWMTLNGPWDYAIRPSEYGLAFPEKPDGTILVPFPLESRLSGVARSITKDERLFYRRTFSVPPLAPGRRLLLHFEAVDWGSKVFLNGTALGDHTGGFDPFSFDITDQLRPGENEIVVQVWDPCDEASEYEPPRGKQVRNPHGIWYTAVTGIWQSVWLEWIPERSIDTVRMVPDVAAGTLTVTASVRGTIGDGAMVEIALHSPDAADAPPIVTASVAPNTPTVVRVPDPILWSPDSPKLYPVRLRYGADRAESYLAFRSVAVHKDDAGKPRIELNGSPIFMLGTLDQGWWPDGLYTAPTYEAMVYDIEVTKDLGFNTIRKHVKIEPATWYAACDRIGLLVWQDMPSSGPYIGPADPDAERGEVSRGVFERELIAMVDRLSFHPSIVMWVPFNEGWGQYDTGRIVDLVRATDPTRLVNNASGWTDRGVGDVLDVHDYSSSLAGRCPKGDGRRAVVIGEYGGLGLPVPGHRWKEEGWGYQTFSTYQSLTEAYVTLAEELATLRADGLCGAIYTQTTDVEIEINGLMSYDRDVLKMNSAEVAQANRGLVDGTLAATRYESIIPCAKDIADVGDRPRWRYTLAAPEGTAWTAPDFDDSAWSEGPSGFGTTVTPGAIIGTEWASDAIWLRRRIEIPENAGITHLLIHHDEDVELFLDGKPLASFSGFTAGYTRRRLAPESLALLTPGMHTLAVRVRQTRGGQFFDCGFVRRAN
jgi:beta-galactosidase/beta-glucuronidase